MAVSAEGEGAVCWGPQSALALQRGQTLDMPRILGSEHFPVLLPHLLDLAEGYVFLGVYACRCRCLNCVFL